MKKILIVLSIAFALTSCSKKAVPSNQNTVELKGTVKKSGMTTYQYGTHTLSTDQKTYALKSTTVDLDTYVDKAVTLKGSKIEGYPVENGPEFIEVTKVSAN